MTALFKDTKKTYSEKDIAAVLFLVGISPGDILYVHSDLQAFGKIWPGVSREQFLGAFVDALKTAVGPEGTVIMPTFTYSFCNGTVYDTDETPSTVGVLTEYFRTLPGTIRSKDAIFSSAARGKDAAFFTDVGSDCFGEGSVFEKLYDRNATLLFLGPRFDITYMHFVEQRIGVSYRYMKNFSGNIKTGNSLEPQTFSYYVRSLDGSVEYDLEKIASDFNKAGILRKTTLANSIVRAVGARDAFRLIEEGIKQNPRFLLKDIPS